MKRLCLAAVMSCLAAPAALAQEHFTEGPVWECGSYRTKQGHFDDYMKYLRQNVLPQAQEAKKAGLTLDQKFYVHVPASPTEPDVVICTLHASFAKALDYNPRTMRRGRTSRRSIGRPSTSRSSATWPRSDSSSETSSARPFTGKST